MLPEKLPILTTTDVLQVIEEAKNAEVCRNVKALREILQSLWNDDDHSPKFDEYQPVVRAELLRLFGFYLTTYGLSQRRENYQERGKDLLTNAIDLFESLDLKNKAAEARVILAFCYWNAGEVRECEAILEMVEADYVQDQLHPVWLQIRINRLMVYYWNEEFETGIKIIEQISQPMQYCADIRLKTMFHNQAAMIYRRKNLFNESTLHFKEAIRFAGQSNNLRFVAATLNNLSLLQRDTKDYETSHASVDEAIAILKSIGDGWFLPHTIDTKASIFLAEEKYYEAFETINEAIKFFEKSEDFRGLAESLWTKTKCLLRLDRTDEALVVFGKLQQISRERIGEATAEKFARALSEEIYVVKGLPLLDEVALFKKSRVSRALRQAKGLIVKAAELLQLRNHKTLSQILEKQFPGLRAELGFERRKPRQEKKSDRTYVLNASSIRKESEIKRIVLSNKSYEFDFYFSSEKFETFYFDKFFMNKFGIKTGAIVAVIQVPELKSGKPVLVSTRTGLILGNAKYDSLSGVYYITDEQGEWLPLDESNIVGEPIGYCPIENAENKFIGFSRLVKK